MDRSSVPLLAEVPYSPDSTRLFEAIADWPWAVFLDSGRGGTNQGRYDILAAEPMMTLCTRGQMTEVRSRQTSTLTLAEPIDVLRDHLQPSIESRHGLPFCGGAIGYFAYDLGRRLERVPTVATDAEGLPEMAVGIYDWALIVDHHERRSWLVGQGRDSFTLERWEALERLFQAPPRASGRMPFRVLTPVGSNMDRQQYAAGFRRIKHYIREGDCYQVNFAQRFSARADGDPWVAYKSLRQCNPAPFAAYLNLPFVQVLSASPERFLWVREGRVETRPIKGTCRRGASPGEDRLLAETLRKSAKDRAENVMIVDLLRNDLGKNCAIGSVAVPKMCELQSLATVHHLVSTITGRLAHGRDSLQLLSGCFPGGSITGAPKLRAMEIIEELEPHRRGIYCGAIGYVGFDGAMDMNIAIRTMVNSAGVIRFWAGGGIVSDSEAEAEYQETLHKSAAMLSLLQGAAMENVGS
ncbi:MAG: aminodeoxychorismate synthase component I [Gammaproteobacteria bacterium]|nr:aminodeoxychorismate synthase component I [Gammaproteobacteria bacterium]